MWSKQWLIYLSCRKNCDFISNTRLEFLSLDLDQNSKNEDWSQWHKYDIFCTSFHIKNQDANAFLLKRTRFCNLLPLSFLIITINGEVLFWRRTRKICWAENCQWFVFVKCPSFFLLWALVISYVCLKYSSFQYVMRLTISLPDFANLYYQLLLLSSFFCNKFSDSIKKNISNAFCVQNVKYFTGIGTVFWSNCIRNLIQKI